jgi:hypothetical protein
VVSDTCSHSQVRRPAQLFPSALRARAPSNRAPIALTPNDDRAPGQATAGIHLVGLHRTSPRLRSQNKYVGLCVLA